MLFLITSSNQQVLSTNIKSDEIKEKLQKCESNSERVFCQFKNQFRRQGLISLNNIHLYICSYDKKITNRIFKYWLEGAKVFGNLIDLKFTAIKEVESQKGRRLKHNIINHNSNILQELYRLVPQDAFKGQGNHIDIIQDKITNETRKAAFTYLRVLKSANLMKAEFDVYEMIDNENPYLDFMYHEIHKVLILTLNPFWLDLAEKKINIHINSFTERVYIDYKSISVSLSHIFDNTVKYIMPNSDFEICFDNSGSNVVISFIMTSLKIEHEEVNKIFEETCSGKWAKELDLNGDGIGMFVVKKLVELNGGTIEVTPNFDSRSTIHYNNRPYENNKIILTLGKTPNIQDLNEI